MVWKIAYGLSVSFKELISDVDEKKLFDIVLTNTICNDECNVLVIPLAVVDDIKTVEYDRDNDDDEGEQ